MKAKLLKKIRKRFIFIPVNDSTGDIEMLDTQTNIIYVRWVRPWCKHRVNKSQVELYQQAAAIILKKDPIDMVVKRNERNKKRVHTFFCNKIKQESGWVTS